MAQKDLKQRIGSVKNIQKITRAMEMVAAARLRRAEQRIEALRPYAGAIRRMTRQAAAAAENIPSLPILQEHERASASAFCSSPATAGWPGAFNSQILRAGLRAAASTRPGARDGRLLRVRPARRVVADVPRARARRAATSASPTARRTRTRARSPRT